MTGEEMIDEAARLRMLCAEYADKELPPMAEAYRRELEQIAEVYEEEGLIRRFCAGVIGPLGRMR